VEADSYLSGVARPVCEIMLRKAFCEVLTKNYSTAIRVAIAIDLMDRYNMSETRASRLTGVPQSLISYVIHGKRRVRGLDKILANPKYLRIVREYSDIIVRGRSVSLCDICLKLRTELK
jgi:predicted transcriptional regulator